MIMSYYRTITVFCAAAVGDKVLDTACVLAKGEVMSVHFMKA